MNLLFLYLNSHFIFFLRINFGMVIVCKVNLLHKWIQNLSHNFILWKQFFRTQGKLHFRDQIDVDVLWFFPFKNCTRSQLINKCMKKKASFGFVQPMNFPLIRLFTPWWLVKVSCMLCRFGDEEFIYRSQLHNLP